MRYPRCSEIRCTYANSQRTTCLHGSSVPPTLNPLCWLAFPGGWAVLRGRAPGRWFGGVLAVLALVAAIGLFVHWLPALPQRNTHWIALLLPIHVGLWLGLRGR